MKTCPHRENGINYTRCDCPVWIDGKHPVTGKRLRRSLGTRDWARGQRIYERWEQSEKAGGLVRAVPSLPDAIKRYLRDCGSRRLASATIGGYERSLAHFERLVNVADVSEITVDVIRDFRDTRAEADGRKGEKTSARTLRKEIEHVRTFCEFCVASEWMTTNASRKVRPPKDEGLPTLPFSPDEVNRLLAAVDEISNPNGTGIERARVRARALLLLLLYSGLRIGDAVRLERSRIDSDGRLLIRMEKTREPLYVKLPEDALSALSAVPVESRYFFWSGRSKISTAVGSARRTVTCLAGITGINAHPHRFRDTFSVELLKSGADLRTVQKLLGHTSIKTTEKHYAPWVRDFQAMLDTATSRLKFGQGHVFTIRA